jgi:hypothetical protein
MSTLKRKLASQANGAKSRGPVTAAGKKISARNSIRHGLLANTFTLPGEAHGRFRELLKNFTAEYQPATETEFALVESLAVARWRQWRLWGLENAALAAGIRDVEAAVLPGDPPMDLPTKLALAFRSLSDGSNSLQLLQRYQSFSFRVIVKSIRTLTELCEARQFGPDPAPDPNPPATDEPAWVSEETCEGVDEGVEEGVEPTTDESDSEDVQPDKVEPNEDHQSPAPSPAPEVENKRSQTNLDIDFPESNLKFTDPKISPASHSAPPPESLVAARVVDNSKEIMIVT